MLKKHKSHFTLILVVLILGLSTLPLLAYQSKAPEPNPLPSKTTDELTVQSTPLSEVTTLSQKQSPEEFIAMMVQPIDSPKVTCKWGCYVGHEAIDVINTQDRYGNVYAVYAGIVVETGYDPVKGNFIIIDHQNSYQTHYHHLGEIYVTMNQEVSQKEVIAAIGKTGISTGPHLHLQLTSEGSNFQIDSLFEE